MNPLNTGGMFHFSGLNPNPTFSSTKEGPIFRVSMEVDRDIWDLFVEANTKGMILDFACEVAEKHADKIEDCIGLGEIIDERPKGGPISKNAGIMCNDPLANIYAEDVGNFKSFKDMIYARCGVNSRAYLDHDATASQAYEELKSEYFQWANT